MKNKIVEWFSDYPAAKWLLGTIFFIWLAALIFANEVNPSFGFASIVTAIISGVVSICAADS